MSRISRRTIIITLPILVVLTLSTGVARGDLDGDGNLDAVFANITQPNRVCLGNGTGGFIACSNVSADTNNSLGMALGFVDADSDLDAVFANAVFPTQPNRVCLGDGMGGFTSCSNVSTDTNGLGVALGFVDGDATLDAVFANSLGSPNRVCLGDGPPNFTFTCSSVSTDTNNGRGVALGFVDGDATLDAVFANSGQRNRVCLGDGAGGFTSCNDVSTDTNNSLGVALGFVDADSDLDAVFANNGQPNRVCLGNGDGTFGTPGNECSDVSADTNASLSLALGFVDGDATLDAVFANSGQRNRVCLGDGPPNFTVTCNDVSADTNASLSLALGFVDGDATLDAVFANSGQRNRVCLGNGDGTFGAPGNECSDVSTDTNNGRDVALGFVDADATLDAVFANNGQRNRVCLGNGDGTFGTPGNECSDVSTDTNNSGGVALGFVDGDATLDAVFANSGQRNRVCLGDGMGDFTSCNDVSADTNASLSLALGFVDGDATLDAVFANSGQRNRVCLGDGMGDFTSCNDVSADTNNSRGVALGLAPTTTTITADTPDPSVVGQDVTVSYTITPVPPGSGTPAGNVTVSDGTNSCTGTVAVGQCTVTLNPPGAKTLTATYTGDSDFQMSADTEPHTVNPLSSSPAAPSGDNGCFIATVAFGSPLAPQVQLLREVRDQYLLPHPVGQGLVALYYTLSPPLAEMIAGSETLRAIVRAGLTPIIGWATLVLWAPSLGMGIPLVALALGVWLALWGVRRRWRAAAGLAVLLSSDPDEDFPDISDDGRER